MRYDNKMLMQEFYDEHIKGTRLDHGIANTRDICWGPWKYLKDKMEDGNLHTIRFKYFGTFVVFPGRVLALADKLRNRLRNQMEPPDKFKVKMDMIKRYLKNYGDT